MTKISTLYSGSSGNCTLVWDEGDILLIDVGKSCRATEQSIVSLGLSAHSVRAIAITHDHIDHIRGLHVFVKKYGVPVIASQKTIDKLVRCGALPPSHPVVVCDPGSSTGIGNFVLTPFATSHDCEGSQGYIVNTSSGRCITLATDMGCEPDRFCERICHSNVVVIESNYDDQMLLNCKYPYFLKQRIKSGRGHLSNESCAQCIYRLYQLGVRSFILAHLSQNSNFPDLAVATTREYMQQKGVADHDYKLWCAPREKALAAIEV